MEQKQKLLNHPKYIQHIRDRFISTGEMVKDELNLKIEYYRLKNETDLARPKLFQGI